MLATPEHVKGSAQDPGTIVWHKPVGRVVEEFQAIACSEDEGIVLPWPKREVPLDLTKPHDIGWHAPQPKPREEWCCDCLAIIRR